MPAPRETPDALRLGRQLAALRKRRGLSQAQVGDALNLTGAGYGSYERGVARLPATDLPRFAAALGVSLQELVAELGLSGDTSAGGDPAAVARAAIADLPLRPRARHALLELAEDLLRDAGDDCLVRFEVAWGKVTEEYSAWKNIPRDAWLVRIEQELRLHMFGE